LFEELALNKTSVSIYLDEHTPPLRGVLIRYNKSKKLLVLQSGVLVPEIFILKIEVEEPVSANKP